MSPKFTRVIEDFVCERCGTKVTGSGYTNHCTSCLWSKHVDINPGDRASTCKGLMEPIQVIQKRGHWLVVHRCTTCSHTKRNKFEPADNFETALQIAKESAKAALLR